MGDIFNVKYNEKLDRLEIPKKKVCNWIMEVRKKHKFFSSILLSLFIFLGINFYLIFSFMKILENI